MTTFSINVVPFDILRNEIEVFFSVNEVVGSNRIHKSSLPKNFFELPEKNLKGSFAWWSLDSQEYDIKLKVNLLSNRRFAKKYLNFIIFEYFKQKQILTNRNFVGDLEILLPDNSAQNYEYDKYECYSLRVENNALIENFSLLVTYEGISLVTKKNAKELKINPNILGRIIFNEGITKYRFLSQNEKTDFENIYPILNRQITAALGLIIDRNFNENKYRNYFTHIDNFYKQYLKGKELKNQIKIFESGFFQPYSDKVNRVIDESNLLLFGNNKTNFVPYVGIKENGPLLRPDDTPTKFIFIFNQEDKELANTLYLYLKKGYKSFPGLESFAGIKFEIDTERSIKFTAENPFEEIRTKLVGLTKNEKTKFDPSTRYAAFYISRIKKDNENEEIDEVYYRLKELLLHYGITSQVIYSQNISNPTINYFLPNIAIALIAKLGGVPWRLSRPLTNDLIIGIGADRSITNKQQYIGNSLCFKNDGTFQKFQVFEKKDVAALAKSIKDSIKQYISQNKGVERLIIHYYKKISDEEEKPIRQILSEMRLEIPYIVITINDTLSKDYILFDNQYDGKMPVSGTFIKIKWNEFLLCNNTRYSGNTQTRIEGFPFPIKMRFKSNNDKNLDDIKVIQDLIDQIYQFSRMYWKSVRQRNKPVTIEYSEIIAKMISHFNVKELGPFAQNSLWFL